MNPKAIINELRRINAWRRGDETVGQPAPGHFGDVLDAAAESLASLVASNTTLRRERRESRAELKQRKADVTRMEEYLRNSGRNMDEAQDQIAERDARVADMSADLARVTAEREAAKAEALGNAASYRDADARRAENYRMLTTVQGERDTSKRREDEMRGKLIKEIEAARALRARVTEVEVQAERYRLATLRQDADLARVTAERDANKRGIEAYLNERVCCSGEACGCGGVTRLQQIVHEESGTIIDRLTSELATLRARVAELEAQIERDAWTLSPEMVQTRNDQLAAELEQAEQRNAELVAALRLALGALEARGVSVKEAPKNSQIAHWYALARAESATPAKEDQTYHVPHARTIAQPVKHPDTVLLDKLEECARLGLIANSRAMRPTWVIELEGDAATNIRAAIDAAMKGARHD